MLCGLRRSLSSQNRLMCSQSTLHPKLAWIEMYNVLLESHLVAALFSCAVDIKLRWIKYLTVSRCVQIGHQGSEQVNVFSIKSSPKAGLDVHNIHNSVRLFCWAAHQTKKRIKQPTVINVRRCSHLALGTSPSEFDILQSFQQHWELKL